MATKTHTKPSRAERLERQIGELLARRVDLHDQLYLIAGDVAQADRERELVWLERCLTRLRVELAGLEAE